MWTLLFLASLASLASAGPQPQKEPLGPKGMKLKADLLGWHYKGGQYGAFRSVQNGPNAYNNAELQIYRHDLVWQDPKTKTLTIKCGKGGDGQIYCGRVETSHVWHTSYDPSLRRRGYLEVRGTLPLGTGGNWHGNFPAWWLYAYDWPKGAEIDFLEGKGKK